MYQDIEQQQKDQLEVLKARLTAEGIPFTVGIMRDVHTEAPDTDWNFDDPCCIINGWTANFDRWGFVIDTLRNNDFLDQGDLDDAIEFIRETVLPKE